MKNGLVQIYTGNGKGKTTAAFGLALRASGQNLKTLIVQFLKPDDFDSGEVAAVSSSKVIKIIKFGDSNVWGRLKPKGQYDNDDALTSARQCWDYLKTTLLQKKFDLVILDEVAAAIKHNLIKQNEVTDFIDSKPPFTELVLTGRNMPEQLIERADLVSEIKNVKHPFDKGITARRGIEF